MTHIAIKTMSTSSCTIGVLTVDVNKFKCFTLELPWIDNKPFISCIPSGLYKYKKHNSPTLGNVIHILNVDGRTWIYIHKGNFTSQIQGCVLVGDMIKDINNDGVPDVGNSGKTFDRLYGRIDETGFIKIVRGD